MKIALLGTGFGQAHAAFYAERPDVDEVVVFGRTAAKLAKISGQFGFATTTDLDGLITDPSVDLVDICLPTRLHADVAVRAMQAGNDVLIELPLATTLEDARRIIAAQQATGRQAFVDMFSRFSPASQQLRQAVADQRYGPLTVLEIEGRTALLWPGYDLGLDSLALDMMHADFDLVTSLLGQPSRVRVTGTGVAGGRGSAAEVLLGYPKAFARCTSSSLMPQPYGVRGGWRATFPGAVLEFAVRAGFTGQGPATLTEVSADRERHIDLPDAGPPYTAVIDHTLACLTGDAGNLIEPASALPALELTLDVHERLTQAASQWRHCGHSVCATAKCLESTGRQAPATAHALSLKLGHPQVSALSVALVPMARDNIQVEGA
jgi:predicted dehydrogenase